MGVVAFSVLMLVEWVVAVVIFDDSAATCLAKFSTLPGVIGLAMQVGVGFATVPRLQASVDGGRSQRGRDE